MCLYASACVAPESRRLSSHPNAWLPASCPRPHPAAAAATAAAQVPTLPAWTPAVAPEAVDWDGLISEVLSRGADVPEVEWCTPGGSGGGPGGGGCKYQPTLNQTQCNRARRRVGGRQGWGAGFAGGSLYDAPPRRGRRGRAILSQCQQPRPALAVRLQFPIHNRFPPPTPRTLWLEPGPCFRWDWN